MEMSNVNKNFASFVSDKLIIGKGSFGEVYGPCIFNRKTFAIKKHWLVNIKEEDKRKELYACRKWMHMRYKRLIRVYDISLEPNAVYIMMEYASGGSLRDVLSARDSDLPLEIVKAWSIQITKGMDYLHRHETVHRDLKSLNVVVMEKNASSNPYNKTLKITDFDQIREHYGTNTLSTAGTYAWMAPEVVETGKFSKKGDVWSFGVVLWEILTRDVPFKDLLQQEIIFLAQIGQLKLDIPDSCDDAIMPILKRCLNIDKEERPFFCEILELLNPRSLRTLDFKIKSFFRPRGKSSSPQEKKNTSSTESKCDLMTLPVPNSEAIGTLEKHRQFLEEFMDPSFELLDKLLANGTIERKDMHHVMRKMSSCRPIEKNSELLNCILAKDQSAGLIKALRGADQIHVANYLTADGEYSDKFGEEWPLSKKDISTLDNNDESLTDLMELTGLLSLLCSSKVINKKQEDLISSKSTSHEKNKTLLYILRRCSLRDYRQTIKCLHLSKQSHIAEVLWEGGVVVKVDANLYEDGKKNISTTIASIIINSSIDQPAFEPVHGKLIAAKTGQSIVFYIYCSTIKELEQLHKSLISGRLQSSIDRWFNWLLIRSNKTGAAIHPKELQKMRTYFKDLAPEDPMVTTTLYDLPLELLDNILENSFLHRILYTSKQSDEDVIKILASVDFCFFKRITKRRFKRKILQLLTDFYLNKTAKKRAAVLRNNRHFLLENIHLNDEFVASLLTQNCITKEQSTLIQQKVSRRGANAELLHIVRSFDDTEFSNFLNCLQQNNQNTVARILENGGGVIKLEVHAGGAVGVLLRYQVAEYLHNRISTRSHQADKLFNTLMEQGIEIISSQLNRRAMVTWVWCRSQAALKYLQQLYELNQLKDVFFENMQPSTSQLIKIDRRQFKITIVVFHISVNFTQRIDLGRSDLVFGVTKLQNEIYVLLRSIAPEPHSIRIFEDQNLFGRPTIIHIQEIKCPTDIGSCENENCLYITDPLNNCVWKVTRAAGDLAKIIKWLIIDGQPTTLSVSRDGRLLLVCALSHELRIYGSKAKLLQHIQLPSRIQHPLHAVETSTGDLVVIHMWFDEEKGKETGSNRGEWRLTQFTRDGQMTIRYYIPSNEAQILKQPRYLSLDSDDRVLVADVWNHEVISLDVDLKWNGILCPTKEEKAKDTDKLLCPRRMCFDKRTKQLIVGEDQFCCSRGINAYTLCRK